MPKYACPTCDLEFSTWNTCMKHITSASADAAHAAALAAGTHFTRRRMAAPQTPTATLPPAPCSPAALPAHAAVAPPADSTNSLSSSWSSALHPSRIIPPPPRPNLPPAPTTHPRKAGSSSSPQPFVLNLEDAAPSAPSLTYAQVSGLETIAPCGSSNGGTDSFDEPEQNGNRPQGLKQQPPPAPSWASATAAEPSPLGRQAGSCGEAAAAPEPPASMQLLHSYFCRQDDRSDRSDRPAPRSPQRGCVLADRDGAAHFKESSLLGMLTAPHVHQAAAQTPAVPLVQQHRQQGPVQGSGSGQAASAQLPGGSQDGLGHVGLQSVPRSVNPDPSYRRGGFVLDPVWGVVQLTPGPAHGTGGTGGTGAPTAQLPASFPPPGTRDDPPAAAAAAAAGLGRGEREVYLNTHEPFCLAAVGVQGGGKSHTLACILEACLVPFPEHGVVQLRQPLSVLVLHYDHNVTSVCEATGLISPAPELTALLGAGGAAAAPPRCLPRERMVVLVSPSYLRQRRAFYGDYCVVRPLLFRWSTLSADHIKKILRIREGDTQLYMATMLDLLRQYQREAVTPAFPVFVQQVRQLCNVKGQEGPLLQRLRLLESIVAESSVNAGLAAEYSDLFMCVKPGIMVVADLTDPLLASDEANGIFQVLTEMYRTIPASVSGGGKLLALDEAHKFMDASSGDGLSEAIVNVARLMRHDGMRLAVSTQSPAALAPELLELVTVAVLHRFHSRDWFNYLAKKLPLPASSWAQIMDLQPGQALVFASQHRVRAAERAGRALQGAVKRVDCAGTVEEEEGGTSRNHVFQVHIRPRITADRGATRLNAAGL